MMTAISAQWAAWPPAGSAVVLSSESFQLRMVAPSQFVPFKTRSNSAERRPLAQILVEEWIGSGAGAGAG